MNAARAVIGRLDPHKVQQGIKWTVYTLLLVNFAFYIAEDWTRALHTLTPESTFLDWTSEFATSIDEAGWFLLLFMFELETYVLEDEQLKGWVSRLLHGVRLVCYVMLAHTVFAYAVSLIDYRQTLPVEGVSSLCEMSDADVSYVFNLEYTAVDGSNCSELSAEHEFFWLGDNPLVTDAEGLRLERNLATVDLAESITWLIIVLAIELVVRMQSRGITGGAIMTTARFTKTALYGLLIGFAFYWATLSHWLYFWDELLWIGGFAAIEMNVSEWRDELLDREERAG